MNFNQNSKLDHDKELSNDYKMNWKDTFTPNFGDPG